jgi:tetratricopeptide (TPR) repeat protein
MPGKKHKTNTQPERSDSPQDEKVMPSQQYGELRSLFGIEKESLDSSRESLDILQRPRALQGVKLEQKKRKNDQELDSDKNKAKIIKSSEGDEGVVEQEIIQASKNKAKRVEGYYSNDDVTILLDALLKSNGFERIRGGGEQDIIRNLETGDNLGTMVLAPIAEDSKEAIVQLKLDIERAYRNNVKQILVPINIPNAHWYTIQFQLFELLEWRALEATIHDSLGIRKTSVVVEGLATQGTTVIKQIEGDLPKIQGGAFGAKNVYCGGYTARLIANIAVDNSIIGEEAWGCPNNIDNILRQEDASIVSEHNSANAGNFGRGHIAFSKILDAAQGMSALRSFIAKEKEFKLLQEFKAIYGAIPTGIKLLITSTAIPEDPAKLSALVREMHGSLPILKILFQTDAQGEIEKDAEGQLKLDTNLEIEQIHNIMVEFRKTCSDFERIRAAESKDDEELEHKESEDVSSGAKVVQPLYKSGNPEAAQSLFNAGVAYLKSGNSKKALEYHELALKMRQSLYKGDHPDVATSLYSMGFVCQRLGDHLKALDYYEQSFNMRLSVHEGNDAKVVASLCSMGTAYHKLGDNDKALNYYGSALKKVQSLKDNHPDVANLFQDIGIMYRKSGDTGKALAFHKNALKMRRSLYKGYHPDVADSLYNVGLIYQNSGDNERALKHHDVALKMRQSIYKSAHSDVADSLFSMGNVCNSLGDAENSLKNHKLCLEMRQLLYKGDHPDVATSLYNTGAAYHKLGKSMEALAYLEPSLTMRQSLYDGDNADIAVSLRAVGYAYNKLGNAVKALVYLEQTLEMMQSLHGDNHPEVATSLNDLGLAHYKLGNTEESLICLVSALEMREALYKDAHCDVATSLHNVGMVCHKLKDNKKALYYKKRSLDMRLSLYKGNHREVASSLHSMGITCMSLGDAVGALTYLAPALSMMQSLYGDENLNVATILYDIGFAHHKLENAVVALGYLENSLRIRQSLHNGNHLDVVNSLEAIGLVYVKLGHIATGLGYQERACNMRDAIIQQSQEEGFKGQGSLSYSSNNYIEYYNGGLDIVLGLRLKNLGSNLNTVLLKSRHFKEGLDSTVKLVQDVVVAFSGSDTKMVLAPVNSCDMHWLGLSFKNLGTIVEVTYMDSEQGVMLPGLRSELENGLALNGYKSRFSEASLTPQRYNNCGYEVIENFVYYLTGTRATQEGAMYVHSLLVENSLLNPAEYGLKIEENNGLIGFLSNTAPLSIRSLETPPNAKIPSHISRMASKNGLPRAANSGIGVIEVNLLQAIKQFNGLWEKWLQDKLSQIDITMYKTNLALKGLDLAVDSGRLLLDPSLNNAKKVALDSAHFYSMYSGVNGYSAVVSGAEAAYQLQQGEYQKAFGIVTTTAAFTSLPYVIAYTGRVELKLGYLLCITGYTAYHAIANALSFAQELYSAQTIGLDSESLKTTINLEEVGALTQSPQQPYEFLKTTEPLDIVMSGNIANTNGLMEFIEQL